MSRREMRARFFWIARWLFGATEYHRGPIEIALGEGTELCGDRLVIRPKPDEEMYDAVDGPAEADRLAALLPRLLATFLSPDGLAVLRYVVERGPVPAKAIATGLGFERSRCYVVVQDLRERDLIRDQGDGYELVSPEVWAELAQRK